MRQQPANIVCARNWVSIRVPAQILVRNLGVAVALWYCATHLVAGYGVCCGTPMRTHHKGVEPPIASRY